jgi:hypothetical protein
MSKLSQLAISLAFDLDIDKEKPSNAQCGPTTALSTQDTLIQHTRTMEERRTFLALFHLTSS